MDADPRLVALYGPTDPRLVALQVASEPMTEDAPTTPQTSPSRSDLEALKDGAAMMIQAGNRVAAMALLWSAVAIDPTDLAAHRRISATLAHAGDIDGAAQEYARYIEFMLPLGEIGRAALELSYGANMLGSHLALHEAAEKIVTAVRAIVPPTNAAIAPAASAIARAASAIAPAASAGVSAIAEVTLPLPAPNLLPKVPFKFCVHDDGDRHWMQLEGGTAELVPDAVRLVDPDENMIETRLCMPLAPGDWAHTRTNDNEPPSVAWVVIEVPNEVVAAIDAGRASPQRLEAKVANEWLSLSLVNSGCRHGRSRASIAAP
jgi:hypothetical protein